MRILDRYLVRECVKVLGLCLVVFIGIYVVVDLFEKLSRFLEAHVSAGLIVRYYVFRLPKIFTEVLPVAVLLACLLSLGGLARNNEVLAMKMGQIGALRIALPCIGVGLAASLLAWVTVEYVAPPASERALNIERTEVRRLPAFRITRDSDIWYRAQDDRFVHISLIEATHTGETELSPDFDLLRRIDARDATRPAGVDGPRGLSIGAGQESNSNHTVQGVDAVAQGTTRGIRPRGAFPGGNELRAAPRVYRSAGEERRERHPVYGGSPREGGDGAGRSHHGDPGGELRSPDQPSRRHALGGGLHPDGFRPHARLGFSLGRSGALPPLVAAWLPNAVFGTADVVSLWRLRR
jgi:hypothetical protein